MPGIDAAQLTICALALALIIIGTAVRGSTDAALRLDREWETAGMRRNFWIALMGLGTLLCFPIGFAGSVAYLTVVRKKLEGDARATTARVWLAFVAAAFAITAAVIALVVMRVAGTSRVVHPNF